MTDATIQHVNRHVVRADSASFDLQGRQWRCRIVCAISADGNWLRANVLTRFRGERGSSEKKRAAAAPRPAITNFRRPMPTGGCGLEICFDAAFFMGTSSCTRCRPSRPILLRLARSCGIKISVFLEGVAEFHGRHGRHASEDFREIPWTCVANLRATNRIT